MFTLFRKIFGVFGIGIILSVAWDSASTAIPAGTAQQADCPGCRLRERVESAQPGDTINIAAGTYTMTGGELVIDKDLTLVGAGAEVTIIPAATSWEQSLHRVISIHEETVVSISGVTGRYGR